jgi:hypothetical protein
MDKRELTQRLARRLRRSQAIAADLVDSLVYKLWKESQLANRIIPSHAKADAELPDSSSAQVKKS